jgi:hypothetical protein
MAGESAAPACEATEAVSTDTSWAIWEEIEASLLKASLAAIRVERASDSIKL